MDKAVEHVERIFGLFFISSDPKQNQDSGNRVAVRDSGGRETGFHGYHEAEGHSSICL